MKNRRIDDRTDVRHMVKATFDEGMETQVQIVDHSVSGVRLILAVPVKLGASARLMIGPDQYTGITKYCKLLEGRRGYTVGVRLSPSA